MNCAFRESPQKTNKTTSEVTQYTYDAENRLTQVSKPGTMATYRYDGLGRRIEKNVNGTITRYVYDNNENILLEYNGSNVFQARYTHGAGINEPLVMLRGVAYFYQTDGLGSITDLSDSTGVVAQSYVYDSFGQIASQSGLVVNPYTYTGREFDSESGLYYYRARYYDARIGRFLQEDPAGLFGGINLYAYVENNPINEIDPEGLFKLPTNLSGLPSEWKPDPTHRDPNGKRYRHPCGRYLDWHPAQPGKPGWRGKDHWHDPQNFGDKHLPPGTEVPDSPGVSPLPPVGKPPIRLPFPFPVIILPPGWENFAFPSFPTGHDDRS